MDPQTDAENLRDMMERCGSTDFNTRQAAFALLCGRGETTRDVLLDGMRHENGTVRAYCTSFLGEISDSDTHTAPLCQMLHDVRVPVRRAAVHALFTQFSKSANAAQESEVASSETVKQATVKQAIDALAQSAANDASPVVRKAAKHAHAILTTHRVKPTPQACPPLPDTRTVLQIDPAAIDSLPPLRTVSIDLLVELLGVKEAHIRREASGVLFARGATALHALTNGFHHPSVLVRRACADLMDHLADETCLPPLTQALGDTDAGVRRAALHSLTCQACKPTPLQGDRINALIQRALHDSDARIRRVATGALADLVHDDRVKNALHSIAENSRDSVCAARARNGLSRCV